jgi:HEAT repeat protein
MAAEGDLKPFLWALNNAESGQSLASYLAGPGAEKLEALLSSLRQASEWDRVRAIAALSEAFRQTTAADSCLAQLKAINPAVRLTAVEIAGMLGTPEAVAALAQVLERDPVPEVRSRAATALAASRADAARTALHRAHAQDPNEVVRVVAARALERRQDVSQEPAELRSAADDAVPFPSDLEEQSKINWAERTPNPTE